VQHGDVGGALIGREDEGNTARSCHTPRRLSGRQLSTSWAIDRILVASSLSGPRAMSSAA
jgi:hypothetical protein